MKKLLLLLFFIAPSLFTMAQNNLSLEQKKDMVSKSYSVILKESIKNQAKEYAISNDYEFRIIEKNFIHLKVIFNTTLTPTDRLAYCNYLLKLCGYNKSSLPQTIISEQIEKLQNKLIND